MNKEKFGGQNIDLKKKTLSEVKKPIRKESKITMGVVREEPKLREKEIKQTEVELKAENKMVQENLQEIFDEPEDKIIRKNILKQLRKFGLEPDYVGRKMEDRGNFIIRVGLADGKEQIPLEIDATGNLTSKAKKFLEENYGVEAMGIKSELLNHGIKVRSFTGLHEDENGEYLFVIDTNNRLMKIYRDKEGNYKL